MNLVPSRHDGQAVTFGSAQVPVDACRGAAAGRHRCRRRSPSGCGHRGSALGDAGVPAEVVVVEELGSETFVFVEMEHLGETIRLRVRMDADYARRPWRPHLPAGPGPRARVRPGWTQAAHGIRGRRSLGVTATYDLAGHVALVTGAAGDFGRTVSRRLAVAGARIVLTDLASAAEGLDVTRRACSALAGEESVLVVPGDVTDPASVAVGLRGRRRARRRARPRLQQRGRPGPHRAAPGLPGRGHGSGHARQRRGHLPRPARGRAAAARGRPRWCHRQLGLHGRRRGCRQHARLQRLQGRRHEPDAVRLQGLRAAGHPRQRHLARLHRARPHVGPPDGPPGARRPRSTTPPTPRRWSAR